MSAELQTTMPYLLGRLWHHIGARRRRHFFALGFLMALAAIAEVVSLGAVMPFLAILAAPEVALKYSIVNAVDAVIGGSRDDLILFFTVVFIVAAVIAGGLRLLLLRAMTRISHSAGSDLSIEVYRRTLYQPYNVHIDQNSSGVLSGVSKVSGVINILSQCLILVSSLVLVISITAALLLMDKQVAIISISGFALSYAGIAVFTRVQLRQNSLRIADEQTRVFRAVQEGLGGIRDILLDGTQNLYCDVFSRADRPLRRSQGDNVFIAGSPRFVMEAIGLVMIATLAFFLSRGAEGISPSIPMLGALALGAQRLLPMLQQSYSAWATIIGSQASLADIIKMLEQAVPDIRQSESLKPLSFRHSITFQNVYFRYKVDGPWVIKDLNLEIPKGSRVGLVGPTGSGKSTVLDIMMGLLSPIKGQVLIDNVPSFGESLRSWQRVIAHVPQNIYLSDATFAENIALGVPAEQIDLELVKRAARKAQIADFIEGCAKNYETKVGERGARLSGGQRQRVGIARALYKKASVLVFDEATSALDNVTENLLMQSIEALHREFTVVIVAHRLSTVRNCDFIVEMANGAVRAWGDYDSLVKRSVSFRRLTGEPSK